MSKPLQKQAKTHLDPTTPERFVDADRAAEFLSLTRRHVLELTRAGDLPGFPLGQGARRVWRFRLSEVNHAMDVLRSRRVVYGEGENPYASKPAQRARKA